MKCPKCNFEQDDGRPECAGCGIIFAKLRKDSPLPVIKSPSASEVAEDPSMTLKELFFPAPNEPHALILAGRALLLVLLVVWSFTFLFASIQSNRVGESFMHLVNLPFHEAGHIIFSFLGRFLLVLGGTLGQLLMPAVCLGVLLVRTRDAFGAAVAQWWLAESFMDIAPYINDARALDLVLLGGVTGKDVEDYHDWEYLLRTLGLLKMDHALAYLAQGIGILLMVAALLWAAANLWIEYNVLKTRHEYS
ncbi:MAG: zinc ribbon domain-containing protein [Desulfatitalea sp.]|nr:zinc ribbon domain-containing protein [Desulfatitalea sp.]MBI5897101.1 zinc ribbon domain-containing protein [Desulfobacterales bacterium]